MTAPRPARFGVPGRLGTGAVIALGLLLVLAATLGPAPVPADHPGARVTVRLPDPVQALVLGLLALSTIIFLSLQRRRHAADETLPPSRAARRMGPRSNIFSQHFDIQYLNVLWQ